MLNYKIKNNRAFTLVETMVAVFILSLTIISLMSVVASSLFYSRYSRDEIIVNYLLQEAVDYIRNDRDSIVFLNDENIDDNWEKFIEKYKDCTDEQNGCILDVYANLQDPNSFSVTKCEYSDSEDKTLCPPFYFNSDPKFYFYNYKFEGVETSFQRKIVLKRNSSNPDEVLVEAKMFWKNGDNSKTRELKTSLLKW